MKKHWIYPVALLGLGLMVDACSSTANGGPGEPIGTARSAIAVTTQTPWPNKWQLGFVEILVADALTACSFSDPNTLVGTDATTGDDILSTIQLTGDSYLANVAAQMAMDWCDPNTVQNTFTPNPEPTSGTITSLEASQIPSFIGTSALAEWYLERQATGCNYSADPSDASLAKSIRIAPDPVLQTVTPGVAPIPALPNPAPNGWYGANVDLANHIVRMPSMNLCIARELNAKAPGSASGEELLLAASDQRELLEVTRERAQMAIIEFAQLAVAFTAPIAATTPNLFDTATPLPLVAAWGQDPSKALTQMGLDFAAAVQLHAVVSQQIADLLGRSASALDPRGGSATTAAAEAWGPGSWRQRTLASLFGGAPLATELDGSAPWGGVLPGALSSDVGQIDAWQSSSSPYGYGQWPSSYLQPFFQTDMSQPEAQSLLALARANNTMDVATLAAPIDTDCTAIDRAATARALYLNTEVALENSECTSPLLGGACGITISPACDTCLDVSCCSSLAACAGDQFCTGCLSEALNSSNGPPQSCLNNAAFLAAGACFQTTSCGSLCSGPVAPSCLVTSTTLPPTCQPYGSSPDFSGCHLYTEHGISPDHASRAANYLGDELEPVCTTVGSWHFGSGARNLSNGTISTSTVVSGGYHLSGDAQFIERGPMQIQPMYARYSNLYTAPQVFPWSSASSQGFYDFGGSWDGFPSGESQRLAGSVSSLVATRESLLDAEQAVVVNWNGNVPSYLAQKDAMIGVITGAVGADSVVIRPVLRQVTGGDAQIAQSSGFPEWSVSVTRAASDPSWQTNGVYPMYAIYDDPLAASLVAYPTTTILNRSAANLALVDSGSLSFVMNQGTSSSTLSRFVGTFFVQQQPSVQQITPHMVTLVASVPVNGGYQFVVLAADVPLSDPWGSQQGYYLSQGGSLTTYAERSLYGQPTNPSKPAFDGFGLLTNWVPPTDPTLFGGTAGQDAATYYLAQAQQAAQQATDAVQQAFTDLEQDAADTAAQAAATQQSQLLIQQQSDGLCGTGNAACATGATTSCCNLTITPTVVLQAFSMPVPACDSSSTVMTNVVNCIAQQLLASAGSAFPIANEVAAHENEVSPPSFSNYSGGSLQAMFVQQWGAILQLNDAAKAVNAGWQAAESQVAAAQALLTSENMQEALDCSPRSMAAAVASGVGISTGFASVTASFTPGPLIAQVQKCATASISGNSNTAQAVAAQNNAILALVQQGSAVQDAVNNLATLSANMNLAIATASRATKQAQLDAQLAGATQDGTFTIYRAYDSYDLFRAQAMVDNARVYAVTARRAIEAKFLVDLSTMTAAESFVAAPSTWADEVYDYDMSLPAAVGLSVTTETSTGVYPNKISDYVGNLQQFVDGYAVSRPTATASGDSNVITLLGPDTVLPLAATQTIPGPSNTLQESWSYYCPATSQSPAQWVQGSSTTPSAEACGGPSPTLARLVFSLDAWGNPNAYGMQEPPTQIFNTRWSQLAVNLVGTGIKNCALAADPLGCYSSSFVPYNLTHVGPSWITDFEGAWHTLNVPLGQINQAKALAAEQWLDPVSNGWAEPYVQAVQRVEYAGRPLDGTYTLELVLGPEVQLGNIERIRILTQTSYWVRQQ